MTSDYKEEFQKLKEMVEQGNKNQSVGNYSGYSYGYYGGGCPSCGYCPHCGRGGYHTKPWWTGPIWMNQQDDNTLYDGHSVQVSKCDSHC